MTAVSLDVFFQRMLKKERIEPVQTEGKGTLCSSHIPSGDQQ